MYIVEGKNHSYKLSSTLHKHMILNVHGSIHMLYTHMEEYIHSMTF